MIMNTGEGSEADGRTGERLRQKWRNGKTKDHTKTQNMTNNK